MEHYENFKEERARRIKETEGMIARFLPEEKGFAGALAKAMNYSMQAGGKRLRPLMLWESYRMFGGQEETVGPFMAAMEMIHTHSLIHDDLPAIDNDRYRRGKETTWVVYGENMGILSGDALLNYAYETAFLAFDSTIHPENVRGALQVLARKTGIHGMLGGQSVDVANDGKVIGEELLFYIYENKTSALIEAALMVGAILAGAPKAAVETMEQIGHYVGLAFQIRDDILDVVSSQKELGKPVRSDEKNHKVTYVTLKGVGAAEKEVKQLSEKALALFDGLEAKNDFLRELMGALAERRN